MSARLKHRMEYAALRALSGLLTLLPLRAALALGWFLAAISAQFGKSRMRRAEERIREVLGSGPSDAEIHRIARTAWRNLMFNAIELMRSSRLTPDEIHRTIDTKPGEPCFELSRNQQGWIAAVGHYGNWDLGGIGMSLLGIPVFSMMRRQRNPLIDAYLNRIRTQFGMGVVERNSRTLGSIIRRLKRGEVLAILPDLRAKDPRTALKVQFLGKPAWIAGGMALFARHANVPIVPAFPTRISWTHHRWLVSDPIWPDLSLSKEEDVQRMTQAVLDRLSTAIINHPEQYFWFNKRWVLEPHADPS